MKRILEEFVTKIDAITPLSGKTILEIGCGTGNYTRRLAKVAKKIEAIDPNKESVQQAAENTPANVKFSVGDANSLDFESGNFDLVIFTLSFHHIPEEDMELAIKEASRVLKNDGHVIFLEPAEEGSFFEAEIIFHACDGDERKEKKVAYETIMNSTKLSVVNELDDKTVFTFESVEDFTQSLHPHKNIEKLEEFLKEHNMTLEAQRRIIICKKAL